MIKTIVFDLGGVYFKQGTRIALPKIYKFANVPKEKVDEFFKSYPKKEGWMYRRGKITKKEFWKAAVKKLEINKNLISELEEIWHSSYKPIKGMRELVSKLGKNYRVIVFSGNIKERIEYLNQKYGLNNDFDDFIFSFDFGFNKREIEFYKILLEKIKCQPDEAVCIDDSQRVLDIEKSLGIKTILFKNAEQVKSELQEFKVNI